MTFEVIKGDLERYHWSAKTKKHPSKHCVNKTIKFKNNSPNREIANLQAQTIFSDQHGCSCEEAKIIILQIQNEF